MRTCSHLHAYAEEGWQRARGALSEAAVPERAAALRRSAQHEPDTRGICAARHRRDTAEDIACDRLQHNERTIDPALTEIVRAAPHDSAKLRIRNGTGESGWGVARAAYRMEWGRKGREREGTEAGVAGTARKTAQQSYASNVS